MSDWFPTPHDWCAKCVTERPCTCTPSVDIPANISEGMGTE